MISTQNLYNLDFCLSFKNVHDQNYTTKICKSLLLGRIVCVILSPKIRVMQVPSIFWQNLIFLDLKEKVQWFSEKNWEISSTVWPCPTQYRPTMLFCLFLQAWFLPCFSGGREFSSIRISKSYCILDSIDLY